MVDDRKKRTPSVHGVTFKPRAQTVPGISVGIPPGAVPDEIDNEETPPPQSVDEAIAWLHLVERFEKIEIGFSAFQQSFPRLEGLVTEFVIPSIKDLMARIDGLLTRQETNSARLELFFDEQWPALKDAVDLLGERLERVERKQDNFVSELALHNDRIARAEKRLDDIDRQLDVINLERHERSVITAERKRWLSWGRAGYAALVAAAGAAGYLVSQLNL